MDASQLFGTIIRILNQPVFPPRRGHAKPRYVHGRPHPAVAAPSESSLYASAPVVRTAQAVRGQGPVSMPAPIAATPASTTVAAPTTQAMRTLEEVRADLARLREHAKRRHSANAQARRDLGFVPTDFMDYGDKPSAARAFAAGQAFAPTAPGALSGAFAPTDFMDMGVIKPS